MGNKNKKWDEKALSLDEEKTNLVEDQPVSTQITTTTNIRVKEKKMKKKTEKKNKESKKTLQSSSGAKKKVAPYILISYTDEKTKKEVSKIYVCHSIQINEFIETSITGAASTKRSDVVNVSIDAKVLGIDQ